jgi:Alginate export
MKTLIKKSIAFIILMQSMGIAVAQFKITGEIRPRMEYRHGYKTMADSAADNALSVDQRTRLNFELKKSKFAFKISLQDVRTWGSQSQLVSNEEKGTSIHEAWGMALLNENWSLKFGRQELVYDDHRIFGNVNWVQQARSHDALLFLFKKEKFQLHLGGAYNQDAASLNSTNYTVGKSYKTLQMAWAHFDFNENINLSLLALGVGQAVDYIDINGMNQQQDNYTLTGGGRFIMKKKKFSLKANAYYQLGSSNTWPAMNVGAYNFALDLSYQVADPLQLTLGYEMLSGNKQTDTSASYNSKQRAFNPYFGTNHKFNGYMDYFYVGNFIGSVGLNDISLRLDYKHDKFNLGLTAHAFLSNAEVLDVNELVNTGNYTAMSSYMGTEIDFFGGFNLVKGISCKLGYSQLFGTATMEALKGGDTDETSNWGWVMIIFKPTLFEQKEDNKQIESIK